MKVSPNTKIKKIWCHKGGIRIKILETDDIPDGFEIGWGPRGTSWNKGLKASDDERVRKNVDKCHQTRKANDNYHAWNKGLTKESDSRVKGLQGRLNPMYGKHREAWNKGLNKYNNESIKKMSENKLGNVPWNKGLTHQIDSRIVCEPRSEETKLKIKLSHLNPVVNKQRFETMKANNNLGKQQDTKAEIDIYNKLCLRYDKEDIIHPYFDQERYPFVCDFYIKSADLFIEVNGTWTHGPEAFDLDNIEHQKLLDKWKEKSKNSKYYKNAIYTWTVLDVRKKEIAKKNNLNYKVIYYKYNKQNDLW